MGFTNRRPLVSPILFTQEGKFIGCYWTCLFQVLVTHLHGTCSYRHYEQRGLWVDSHQVVCTRDFPSSSSSRGVGSRWVLGVWVSVCCECPNGVRLRGCLASSLEGALGSPRICPRSGAGLDPTHVLACPALLLCLLVVFSRWLELLNFLVG